MSTLEKLSNIVSETAKSLSKKSGEFIEVGKLTLDAQKKQERIQEIYEEMGEYVYSRLKRGSYVTKEEVLTWIQQIHRLEEGIEDSEKMALRIRNIKHCQYCRIQLEKEDNYCPICGKYAG